VSVEIALQGQDSDFHIDSILPYGFSAGVRRVRLLARHGLRSRTARAALPSI
jgi:hypothetical protein